MDSKSRLRSSGMIFFQRLVTTTFTILAISFVFFAVNSKGSPSNGSQLAKALQLMLLVFLIAIFTVLVMFSTFYLFMGILATLVFLVRPMRPAGILPSKEIALTTPVHYLSLTGSSTKVAIKAFLLTLLFGALAMGLNMLHVLSGVPLVSGVITVLTPFVIACVGLLSSLIAAIEVVKIISGRLLRCVNSNSTAAVADMEAGQLDTNCSCQSDGSKVNTDEKTEVTSVAGSHSKGLELATDSNAATL